MELIELEGSDTPVKENTERGNQNHPKTSPCFDPRMSLLIAINVR